MRTTERLKRPKRGTCPCCFGPVSHGGYEDGRLVITGCPWRVKRWERG